MDTSLRKHLAGLNADVLKDWLRAVGALEKGVTSKENFIRAIHRQLTLNLRDVLPRLSDAERALLAECAHHGRFVGPREFQARHGIPGPYPEMNYHYRQPVSLLTPILHLPHYRDPDPAYLVSEVEEKLRELLPAPPEIKVRTVERIPKAWPSEVQRPAHDPIRPISIFEGERIGPLELARMLRLVQAGKIKVTESGRRPTEATARLMADSLLAPDFNLEMPRAHLDEWERKYYTPAGPVRAHAWPVLVQQCGWAKSSGSLLTLTPAGREILHRFDPERFRAGVSCLLENDDFDELNRINHIRGQSGKGSRYLSPPSRRKEVIREALRICPVGQWLAYQEALRLVNACGENWDVLTSSVEVLSFFGPEFGFIHNNAGLCSQYLRAFLMETLGALGLFDLAYVYPHNLWPDLEDSLAGDLPFCGRYDGLLYVRLNPLGAYALGYANHYDFRPDVKPFLFRVLPNMELILTDEPLNPADRAILEMLAEPKNEKVWVVYPERLLTHVETGGSLAELRAFLETNASEELPENVQEFLDELDTRTGACRSQQDAVLLEWADESLARLVATHASTSRLCFHAGGNRVVVPKANLAAFSRAVKKLGYVLPPR